MISKQISPDFQVFSFVDKDLRVFLNDSYTDSGMMFNTYLAKSEQEAVVFGAPPKAQTAEWLDHITPHIADKQLTYVSFCDSSDAQVVQLLAEHCRKLTVVGTFAALYAMEDDSDTFRKIFLRGRRTLTLCGIPFTFEAEAAGNLCVFCESKKLVLTGKALGSYYAAPEVLLSASDAKAYQTGAKNYRRDTTGKERLAQLEKVLASARDMGAELICPVHGPVVDCNHEILFNLYQSKSAPAGQPLTVALLYAAGGYTDRLAEKLAEGLTESGSIQVDRIDLSATSRDEALERAARADALLLGTPEVKGRAAKAVYDIVTSLSKADCKGKLAGVFYSIESPNCDRDTLHDWLASLGFDTNTADFFCVGKPDEAMLNAAFEHGFAFGCSLQRIPNPRKPKLVKCLVCGEIFDASLGICPVCGVGLDQCIPAEEDAVAFTCDTDRSYLILGGGVAAVSAADAIRKRDKTGTITILSAERELPINRPLLTKDLRAAIDQPEAMLFHEQAWYDEREIRMVLGCTVTAIHPDAKTVAADNGEIYPYDKLIYALGGECFIPPFKGKDTPGVIAIRHMADIEELSGYLTGAKHAVVIGGGALGLEAASELHRFGLKITVLESAPQIVARQLDAENAALFRAAMERMGVPCYEGVSIEEICGEDQVTGVRLADGRLFEADVVVVSCGTRSTIALAQQAGIAAERGVIVNSRMETNLPDIYSCGDCAQLDGMNYQLWQEATDQGRTAGANAAGEPVTYTNHMFGCTLAGFGANLFALGDVGKQEGIPYRKVELKDDVRGKRETYWFLGESLTGAVIFNKPEKTDTVSAAVMSRMRYDELFH